MSFWNAENVAELLRLNQQNLSATTIAAALFRKTRQDVSRNMVIGKLRRMGLACHSQPAGRPTFARQEQRQRVKQERAALLAANRAAPAKPVAPPKTRLHPAGNRVYLVSEDRPLPPTREVATGVEAKPWLERTFGECNWIVAGQGADAMACCAPAYQRGWCRAHFRTGTAPPKSGQPRTGNQLMRALRRFVA